MKKIGFALALAGAFGLAACTAEAPKEETGSQPAKSAVEKTAANVEQAMGDAAGAAAAATATHTLKFTVDGMT